jgi:FKBP-type peptidyl-prolyl cis-trans isomerase
MACAASVLMTLAACSSDKTAPSASTSAGSASTSAVTDAVTPGSTKPVTADSTCPSAAPADGGTPEWTLTGASGSVAVTGSTDTTAPRINVTAPFGVTQTEVHTLHAGDGPVVAPTATVSVCYLGVNGRDGHVFDSAYERGSPEQFPLDGVVPGFQKAIVQQKVGSTVGVAMTSMDGYPDGQPNAGIEKGDTLVFAIKILSASG